MRIRPFHRSDPDVQNDCRLPRIELVEVSAHFALYALQITKNKSVSPSATPTRLAGDAGDGTSD